MIDIIPGVAEVPFGGSAGIVLGSSQVGLGLMVQGLAIMAWIVAIDSVSNAISHHVPGFTLNHRSSILPNGADCLKYRTAQ